MKALVQRVLWAEVEVDRKVVGRIGYGLLVYVGVASTDVTADAERLADKVIHLRIFEDEAGRMNRSVQDARGSVLAVSNPTALADGGEVSQLRPAWSAGDRSEVLFGAFVGKLRLEGCPVETGMFGATMIIRSTGVGPVNVILDMPPFAPNQRPESKPEVARM